MLWSGRFGSAPSPDMLALTRSIDIDLELLECDTAATKAHARALVEANLLEAGELVALDAALDELCARWRSGALRPADSDEDVHSLVERHLTESLGETGARIHAGRSRNDLVATDLRLWSKAASGRLIQRTCELLDVITRLAEEHAETIMPGYTHLQRAQPVTLGFHLTAHGCALVRDGLRFSAARDAADVCALGAGALAGNTLGLDPQVPASELGFQSTFENAMDAVADRDFACDLAYAAALCGVHLSRLAEEIVLWTSAEFGFMALSDEWSTGSSMMPQKRNPDMAELIRGRAAAGIGDLATLLALLKGLPLAYNRDLQEDKAALFSTVARVEGCLGGMSALLRSLVVDAAAMEEAAAGSGAWATNLAEALVSRGVPFREAHGAAGRVVALLESRSEGLAAARLGELRDIHPAFEASDLGLGDARVSVTRRSGPGATAPEQVRRQIEVLRSRTAELRAR